MKRFIDYPKEYENVFVTDELKNKYEVEEKYKMSTDLFDSFDDYKSFFKNFLQQCSEDTLFFIVRYKWLQRRFFWNGIQKKNYVTEGYPVNRSYAYFTKKILGINHYSFTRSFLFGKIDGYLKEFYPDTDKHNPFESLDYYRDNYPFKHVTVDFLATVYQMPERMDLLWKAEEKEMGYYDFLDYVTNYIYVYNEKHNKEFYSLVYSTSAPTYVRFNTGKLNKNRYIPTYGRE